MTTSRDDDLAFAAQLRALGHPARLAIVRALAGRDACLCGDLVRGLPLAQSTVSEHLRILREASLVRGVTKGERGACYGLDHEALAALHRRIGDLLASSGGEGVGDFPISAELGAAT